MPMLSVVTKVQEILNDLPIPGGTQTLQAFIVPPLAHKPVRPTAVVWASRAPVDRRSMPRGEGFKQIMWTVDVWLMYLMSPQVPNLDQQYPLVVDAVMAAMWATPMAVTLTDPVTGLVTQMTSIGEAFTVENAPVRSPENQSMYYFTGKVSFTVKEWPQA